MLKWLQSDKLYESNLSSQSVNSSIFNFYGAGFGYFIRPTTFNLSISDSTVEMFSSSTVKIVDSFQEPSVELISSSDVKTSIFTFSD